MRYRVEQRRAARQSGLSQVLDHAARLMSAPTFFANTETFRNWLAANAGSRDELLVGFRKVGSGVPSISWPESVNEALCFGWIDGVRKRIDDTCYSILFTPRKPTSIWSAVNIGKVEELRAQGRMMPSGELAFALRKESKSVVYAYEQPATAEFSTPELAEFRRQKAAWTFFENTPPSYKKTLLHWVTTAKKPETRAGRLTTLINACADGKRLR